MKRSRSSAGLRLKVTVTDAKGRPIAEAARLARWLTAHAPASARGSVTIALVPDAVVRRLNRTFRGKDAVTDVLSFPSGEPRGAKRFLGDVVIATGVCRRQARDEGHASEVEARILALHGLLHLLRHDHETDNGMMRRTEERLRQLAGLPAGLIARAVRRSPPR